MDKLYLDANVILDFLQERSNSNYVQGIFIRAHNRELELLTSVLNFATIFYFESRAGYSTKEIIGGFRNLNRIIKPVDQTVLSYNSAIQSEFKDFEDALQYFAAIECSADCIITENKRGFKNHQGHFLNYEILFLVTNCIIESYVI